MLARNSCLRPSFARWFRILSTSAISDERPFPRFLVPVFFCCKLVASFFQDDVNKLHKFAIDAISMSLSGIVHVGMLLI